MKKIDYLLMILILFAGFSCKKDTTPVAVGPNNPPKPPPTVTVYNYLDNYDSSNFINGNMPLQHIVNSSCPKITAINGNAYVIPGGTNQLIITFTNNQNITELYYGVKGVYGYYKVDFPQTSSDSVFIVIILSQALVQSNFDIQISLADTNGNISAPYYLPVDMITADPGKLQVSLSCEQSNTLGLYLVEPNNFDISDGHPIDLNTKGYLDIGTNGARTSANIEDIIFPDSVPPGTYSVIVEYISQTVASANSFFSVTALYDGQLIAPSGNYNYTNPCFGEVLCGASAGDNFNPFDFKIGNHSKLAHFNFPDDKHFRHHPTKVKYGNTLK
jgi:hypothetical protein